MGKSNNLQPFPSRTILIPLSVVCFMTARSRSSIYREMEQGNFPLPVKNGEKSNAWHLSEIEEWIQNLPRRKWGF